MAPAPQWLTNDFFKDIIKRAIDHEISISDDEIIAYISKKRNNQIKSKTWITYVELKITEEPELKEIVRKHMETTNQRPKFKKMRGGVTRKLLTRRKVSDLTREIGLGHGGSLNTRIKEFVRPALTNQSIRYAVQHYLAGGARKKRIVDKYGEISNWDTSSGTYMQSLFYEGSSFNQPLNKWNVSNVTNMRNMFA